MPELTFEKVTELPTQLVGNRLYLLLSPDANSFEMILTDSDGTIALPLKNSNPNIMTAGSYYLMGNSTTGL
jgi:hypothetical protein